MFANIPTTIVTGFLGVGKTTALNYLISQKPSDEVWAIVVNEFGQIGIDQTAITTDNGIQVKELTGGCVCCALGPALSINLAQLIRKAKPQRVIIEPTGLGHPAGIMDILQSQSFQKVLDVQNVICLVDPRVVDQPDILNHPTFMDQLNLADTLILNKCDLASDQQVEEAYQLSLNMFPPKKLVYKTSQGHIPLELLNGSHESTLAPSTDSHMHTSHTKAPLQQLLMPSPGQPVRRSQQSDDANSCGWVFNQNDQFDHDKLHALFSSLTSIWRLKGVFRIGEARVFYNRVIHEMDIQPISWRRDSRLEIISEQPLDWDKIEAQLLNCLKPIQSTREQ